MRPTVVAAGVLASASTATAYHLPGHVVTPSRLLPSPTSRATLAMGLFEDIMRPLARGKPSENNPFDDAGKAPLSSGSRPWDMPEKEGTDEYWTPGDAPSWEGAFAGFMQGLNFNAALYEERQAERAAAAAATEESALEDGNEGGMSEMSASVDGGLTSK